MSPTLELVDQDWSDERVASLAIATLAAAKITSPLESYAPRVGEHGAVQVWQELLGADKPVGPLERTAIRPSRLDLPQMIARARDMGARFVIPGDAEWPATLQDMGDQAPYGLWVMGGGNLAELSRDAIAFTGPAAASSEALDTTRYLATRVAQAGRAVVGRLIGSIEPAALAAAADAHGPTITIAPRGLGVLGQVSDQARRGLGEGVLISAFPLATGSLGTQQMFSRARVLAGVSPRLVVTQMHRVQGPLSLCMSAAIEYGHPVLVNRDGDTPLDEVSALGARVLDGVEGLRAELGL